MPNYSIVPASQTFGVQNDKLNHLKKKIYTHFEFDALDDRVLFTAVLHHSVSIWERRIVEVIVEVLKVNSFPIFA